MNKLNIAIVGILLFAFFSCKPSKEAATPDISEPVVAELTQKTDSFPATSRLVLTFFSPASGVDIKSVNRFEEFIGEYAGEIGINIDYEKTHWGREGETDFCLELSELDAKQQADFVSKTKILMEKAEHLNIYENSPCKHRRKRE
ncbi:MAG TPA: hypothetical protein PKJ62_04270 [Bacteroidia bacterium]|nr:hypothetical protein [Bacteroidia bacterium]HNS13222.1 hypothetical protein [Bacteroidia bacterium]